MWQQHEKDEAAGGVGGAEGVGGVRSTRGVRRGVGGIRRDVGGVVLCVCAHQPTHHHHRTMGNANLQGSDAEKLRDGIGMLGSSSQRSS